MGNPLLRLVIYYPGYPPLKSVTNSLFVDCRDFIVSVDGFSLFQI